MIGYISFIFVILGILIFNTHLIFEVFPFLILCVEIYISSIHFELEKNLYVLISIFFQIWNIIHLLMISTKENKKQRKKFM
jgi:hypothetical protein